MNPELMKIGDLVKHNPSKSTHPAMAKIYGDWGHERDFKAGLIIDTRDNFAHVMPSPKDAGSIGAKPAWYQFEELEVISEGR